MDKVLVSLLVLGGTAAQASPPDIPVLPWQERSDWINVKTDVTPLAIGDGHADDTAALQAALELGRQSKAVYLPPGIYRITKTLVFQGPAVGCLVVGHGRDPRLVWDGPRGGRMFWSNGVAYSRFVGLSWDGLGKAAVGFDHAAQERFETEVRHEHEAFRNFTEYGIRVGHQQKVASAEILYRNCLLENCGTGLAFLTFNDYDNTIDGCEFRNCGTGVLDNKGNFYARNCHFVGSRHADFRVGSEHGSSIRRCTSVGSRRFIEEQGTIAPLTIQDCHVADWTDPDGAVHLNGSPVLMFDCSFARPPSDRPPVKLSNLAQQLLLSNNRPATVEGLVQTTPTARLAVIPPGRLGGVITSAAQRFLRDSATVPGRVFDAVADFGAQADGNLRITGSDRALLLFRTSYEGTVTIAGPAASAQGFVGFMTRLATQSKPTLRIRDNRSVVMSDFYNEQSDQHLVFEGAVGQPEGAVTIQGPKMHMFTQEPVFDIRDYSGRIYYGQSQFYVEPKEPRFVSQGTRPVRLILAGHFWYDTKPRFELGPEVTLTMLANREIPDVGVDVGAVKAIAAALNDLRRLGELDQRLSSLQP